MGVEAVSAVNIRFEEEKYLTRRDVRRAEVYTMVSVTHGRNIKELDWVYNFQHVVLVSKYRFKVFKNPKTQKVVADAFKEVEVQFGIRIKEFAFGDDYAHIHMMVNVPANLSMQQVRQILKSHSASKVFREMPNFIKRYPDKSFWGVSQQGRVWVL